MEAVALNRGGRPLFSARWVEGLAPVAEAGMVATIRVYRTDGEPIYDPDEDEWLEDVTEFYSGKARVQPVRSSREVRNTGDSTYVQRTRFQVPVGSIPDIRPDMLVRVTDSPHNRSLEADVFVVVETTDSSNPFEQTFECTTNIETEV